MEIDPQISFFTEESVYNDALYRRYEKNTPISGLRHLIGSKIKKKNKNIRSI